MCTFNGIVILCKTECGSCGFCLSLSGKAVGCQNREKSCCTTGLIHCLWEVEVQNKNLKEKYL